MKKVVVDNIQYYLIRFVKNGKTLMPIRYLEEGEYYPTIGMGSPGAKVTTNLGETDFTFTFDGK